MYTMYMTFRSSYRETSSGWTTCRLDSLLMTHTSFLRRNPAGKLFALKMVLCNEIETLASTMYLHSVNIQTRSNPENPERFFKILWAQFWLKKAGSYKLQIYFYFGLLFSTILFLVTSLLTCPLFLESKYYAVVLRQIFVWWSYHQLHMRLSWNRRVCCQSGMSC